jgi:hypothetical protein
MSYGWGEESRSVVEMEGGNCCGYLSTMATTRATRCWGMRVQEKQKAVGGLRRRSSSEGDTSKVG